MLQVTDNTYTSGSPGIGFFLQGASGLMLNYGFSNFTATIDGHLCPANFMISSNLRIAF